MQGGSDAAERTYELNSMRGGVVQCGAVRCRAELSWAGCAGCAGGGRMMIRRFNVGFCREDLQMGR